jgi:prepilin-type processing-associated H-X9-DG protein
MYNQENNYMYPYPTTAYSDPAVALSTDSKEKMCWFTALDGYIGPLSRDNQGTSANAVTRRNFRKFKQCPIWASIETTPGTLAGTVQNVQQYARTLKMNTNLRQGKTVGGTTTYTLARVGDIDQPADFVTYGDGVATDMLPWGAAPGGDIEETGCFNMDTTTLSPNGAGVGDLATRHNGAANITFADGHAAKVTLKTTRRLIYATSSLSIDAWSPEWLTSAGAPVTGTGKLIQPVELSGYRRNPDMPLIWSIPGKIYR